MVSGTLYRIGWPGMVKPSIAMKCIAQMPVAPRETEASSSHRARWAPAWARARVTQRRPMKAPRQDIR